MDKIANDFQHLACCHHGPDMNEAENGWMDDDRYMHCSFLETEKTHAQIQWGH